MKLNDRQESMSHTGRTGIFLAVLLAAATLTTAAEKEWRADLWSGVKNAIIGKDPQADGGRCVVANLSQPAGQAFLAVTAELSPGVYQALLHIKLSTNNNINTAPLAWSLAVEGAGSGKRNFDILAIEKAGVYQDIPCAFVVAQPGRAKIALTWRRAANSKTGAGIAVRIEKSDIPTAATLPALSDKTGASGDLSLDAPLSSEPPIEGIRYLYMAIDKVVVTPVADVELARLEVDKIRYKPGEKAKVSVAIRNLANATRSLKVETVFINDLETVIPVDERTIQVAGAAPSEFECAGPPFEKEWGYAVRCRVFENGKMVTEQQDYFTVHSNLWAVVMSGRAPTQFTAHVTRENAVASARDNKRRYRNWIESGFWAPDEFGDFTPDTEFWWSGQGCYYGSITGTKIMIEEGHKAGIAYAVYANIFGGDGPPAFEQVRARPDWGHASSFDVEWFDRWDRNTMGTGKAGMPMHVWPLAINNYANADVFKHHGRELIGTHQMFGWDAVRYDSHDICTENARVVEIVKKVVRAEVPDFQFGYNSSVPHGVAEKIEPFKAQCEGGGLIMEEGIRQYGSGGMSFSGGRTYKEFAERILDFKEEARRYGGHFLAIGMDKCFSNDLLYQDIFWFAANTHPCFDSSVSVADYAQFATRFAGQLWDLNVTSVTNMNAWLDLGDAAAFLWMPERYTHQRDLGGGRRQLIIHLINTPLEKVLYTHDDAKLPPPRENFALRLKLPSQATVRSVWLLTAEPVLTQTKLAHELKNGQVLFTVPRLRFWDVVVVDLDKSEVFK